KQITDGLDLFRLITQGTVSVADTKFQGKGEALLKQMLRLVLFRAVHLTDVERDRACEQALREKFAGRLRACFVAKTAFPVASLNTLLRTEAVAFLAARELRELLPRNAVVGLTGGTTVGRFADFLALTFADISTITWVPLVISQQVS